MLNRAVAPLVLVGALLVGALSGCAGPGAAAGMSVADKKALDDPLFVAELVVAAICPPTTTKFDDEASQCAAVLNRTTVNIAKVHTLVREHGIEDAVLDDAAMKVGAFAAVCDPYGPGVELRGCLNAAEAVKTSGQTYVQTLRAKLDAVK